MVRRGARKAVDPARAEKYRHLGAALVESARALLTVADEGDRFGNAIAIVAVHAVIAYTDALTISYGGFKSTEGDHRKAVDALQDALSYRAEPTQVKQLRTVLSMKDQVSYSGAYYKLAEAEALLSRVVDYAGWAEEMYMERPRP